MKMRIFAAIVSCLLGAAAVLAASGQQGKPATVVASGYDYDTQSAVFRAAVATVDTPTTAIILATPEFLTGGKPTITVSGRASASGATCTIQLAYVYKTTPGGSATSTSVNYIKGYSAPITLTAGMTQYEGTYYPAPDAFFDTEGATAVRVIVTTAPSSGTVDLWVGSN